MAKIRIVLVDDHSVIREGLSALISGIEDMEVAGEASNGEEAVRLAKKHGPDVVLMDIGMPVMDGIEATRAIKSALPGVKVLVLSAHDDEEMLFAAIRANASGYILKNAKGAELVSAIRAVHLGEMVFHPKLTRKLVEQAYHRRKRITGSGRCGELSKRELEVVKLGRRGMSNKEIACALSLSERTIHTHWRNVFQKLGVNSRVQAIMNCIEKRFFTINTE